jgi:hypothetical protein
MGNMFIGGAAVFSGKAGGHRGHHQAIFQIESFDLNRVE